MADEIVRRHGDLEIDEDPAFQKVTWNVERIAWAALAALLIAAVAGVFGHGPASRAKVRTADEGLEIDYPRATRLDSSEQIELRFRASGPQTVVELSDGFSDHYVVETVLPEPERQQSSGDGLSLAFATPDHGAEQRVVLHVRPRRPAFPVRTGIGLQGGPKAALSTVVFP